MAETKAAGAMPIGRTTPGSTQRRLYWR